MRITSRPPSGTSGVDREVEATVRAIIEEVREGATVPCSS